MDRIVIRWGWVAWFALVVGCSPGEVRRGTTDVGVDAGTAHVVGAGDYPQPQQYVPPLYVDAGKVFVVGIGGIDAATSAPLTGNGTVATPITLAKCDAGELVGTGTDAGTPVCRSFTGGPSSISATSPLTVNGGSGPVSSGAATVALATPLSVANGGTGAAMTCSSANVVQATSGTALACHAMSGDCTISSSGVLTCTQLQGGEIAAGATTGTLTCASGATACGLSQASTFSATGVNTTISSQGSTATNGTPGNVVANIPAATGSGSEGGFQITRSGSSRMYAGAVPGNVNYDAICFGATSSSCATSNYAFLEDHANTYVSIQGPTLLEIGTNTYGVQFSIAHNVTEVGTAQNQSAYGGTNVFGIDNGTAPTSLAGNMVALNSVSGAFAVTPGGSGSPQFEVSSVQTAVAGNLQIAGSIPTTCPGGSVCLGGSTADLYARAGTASGSNTETHLAPAGDAYSYLDYGSILRTGSISAGGGTGTVAWPHPQGYVCWLHVTAIGNYSTGSAGTAADVYAVFRNSAGTVAKVGILGSAANPIQSLGASGAVADTHFNTASSGPIGTGSLAAGSGGTAGDVVITVTNESSSGANAFEVFVEAKCSGG